jgi:hypothetical protein
MKNPILLIIIVLAMIMNAYPQGNDTITQLNSKYYLLGGKTIPRREIPGILANNPASAIECHQLKVTNWIGGTAAIGGTLLAFVGVAGGFLNSMAAMDGESGNHASSGLIVPGIAIEIVGIVIIKSNPHYKRGINLYNSNVKSRGLKPVQFSLSYYPNCLGIRMTF